MTASLLVSQNFGLLLAYAIGAFSLNAIAIFSTFLMIISIILIYFIPESSLFLLKRGRLAVSVIKSINSQIETAKR